MERRKWGAFHWRSSGAYVSGIKSDVETIISPENISVTHSVHLHEIYGEGPIYAPITAPSIGPLKARLAYRGSPHVFSTMLNIVETEPPEQTSGVEPTHPAKNDIKSES